MYTNGKYIVGEVKDGYGTVTALCFNDVVSHDTFRNMFTTIYGAGFFGIDDAGKVCAWGNSISLKVESRDQDILQIERALGFSDTRENGKP